MWISVPDMKQLEVPERPGDRRKRAVMVLARALGLKLDGVADSRTRRSSSTGGQNINGPGAEDSGCTYGYLFSR